MNQPYEIVLDQFTGPLDLLLHLIRTQEVNIHDIPIASITDQFLSFIHAMEELELDIASEFVVMAAWLLAIKSRMLLPRPPVENEGEEASLDPRDELVSQLLEYERAKWAALELGQRQTNDAFMVGREPADLTPYRDDTPAPVVGITIWDLVDAYRKLLARVPKEQRIAEIKGHVRGVGEMMEALLQQLRVRRVMSFWQLLGSSTSRQELVSAFLALLELVKEQRVTCRQNGPYDDIEIGLLEEIP